MSFLTSFFCQYEFWILKYFNNLKNRSFLVLWLSRTQAMEMKQNQTFFHETYSNLTLFFIDCKILKYLNEFYSWYLSILLQKWTQTGKTKIKSNGTYANLTAFFLICKVLQYFHDFWNLFHKAYFKSEW